MKFVFIDGEYLTYDQAYIPITDRGWRLGDGLFETIRITDGKPWLWSAHIRRLNAGIEVLKLPSLENDLVEASRGIIARNDVQEGILRISLTRDGQSSGYLPVPQTARTRMILETMELPHEPDHPVRLFLSSIQKTPDQSIPSRIKTIQGMNSMLARMEADSQGALDALLLDLQGNIAETSSGNIFWFKNGKLHTPALSTGILPGTTRDAIIRLSPYPTIQSDFRLDDIKDAEEVFMTNSVRDALRFDSLIPDDISWGNCGISTELNLLLIEDRKINVGFDR